MKVVPDIDKKPKAANPLTSGTVESPKIPKPLKAPSAEEVRREVSHNMGHEWKIIVNGQTQGGRFYSIASAYRYLICNFFRYKQDIYKDSIGRDVIICSIENPKTRKRVAFFLCANEDLTDCDDRHKKYRLTDFNTEEWLDYETNLRIKLFNDQQELKKKLKQRSEESERAVEEILESLKEDDAPKEEIEEAEAEELVVELTLDDSPSMITLAGLSVVVLFTLFGIVKWLF